ncbi:MAG: peptide deformylase [Rhodospirillales bacterium]|nr:peptide deformylase [Alphaproteobacteria bacterium]MBL6947944.1 peptide deformylase [Rhodospirillales bacterium]
MAILKIARMGHPVLARAADPVESLQSREIRRLVADMVDTLDDTGGVGLAAPQVHVPKRVVVFHVPENRARAIAAAEAARNGEDEGGETEAEAVPMTVLINPAIEPLDEETALGVEGCLSLPGMIGMVPRYKRIRYRADSPDGSVIEREASGFHARVVQHECDHLDGILYPMRMDDLTTFGYSEEMGRDELPLGERMRRD